MMKLKLTRISCLFLALLILFNSVPPIAFASAREELSYMDDTEFDDASDHPEIPAPDIVEEPELPAEDIPIEKPPEEDPADHEEETDESSEQPGETESESAPEQPDTSEAEDDPIECDDEEFEEPEDLPSRTVILRENSRRVLVDDRIITMSAPTLSEEDILLAPIDSIDILLEADVIFDDATLIVRQNERTVVLEMDSWIMQIWTGGALYEALNLEDILAVKPIQIINDAAYVVVERLFFALGLYVREIVLDGYIYAVVTLSEISIQEARGLALGAQNRLDDPDFADEDNEFDEELDSEEGAIVPFISVNSMVVQENNTRAVVDEVHIHTTAPVLAHSNTMFVPVRDLSALMGATAQVSGNVVSVGSGSRRVELEIGSLTMRIWVNGIRQPDINMQDVLGSDWIAQPPQFLNGLMYAPLRVLALALNGHVEWRAGIPGASFVVVSMFPLSAWEIDRLINNAEDRLNPSYIATQSVSISPASVQLVLDNGLISGTRQLTGNVLPTNATNRTIRWSSNNSTVAAVNASGFLTPSQSGSAVITALAADNGVNGTRVVNVVERASSVTLNQTNLTLTVQGDIAQEFVLSGNVFPLAATNRLIRWETSNPNIATVDQTGRVRAVNPGTVSISAHVDGSRIPISTSATVTVRRLATDIFLDRESMTLSMTGPISETEQIGTTVFPTDAFNANNIVWTSSDPNVATVDQNGTVTSVNAGDAATPATTTIRATVQGSTNVWAETVVSVQNRATGVALEMPSITMLIEGDQFGSRQLTETVQPLNAVNRDVTWSVYPAGVVTVDQTGMIHAINAGSAVVTVSIDGTELYTTCVVNVIVIPTGITLNYTARTLSINNPARNFVQLEATIDDASEEASTIIWASDDPNIATVNSNGTVTATGLGVTYIRATVLGSGIFAVCRITVVNEVSSISVPKTATLEINGPAFESTTLPVAIFPEYASNPEVI